MIDTHFGWSYMCAAALGSKIIPPPPSPPLSLVYVPFNDLHVHLCEAIRLKLTL